MDIDVDALFVLQEQSRMDRFQAFGVFARVAETQSFSEASRGLGLSKARVSDIVRELETRLGARLLQRTTRRVELTHDGSVFYERCKDLLSDAEELEGLFQDDGAELEGRIRVDVASRFARFILIPALPRFLEAHPKLLIELGSTDRRVDLVREGYDCVIRAGKHSESGLVARKLGELELINCASPAYLKKHGTPRSLADLSKHLLVHYVPVLGARPDGWDFPEGDDWKTVPMKGRIVVNNAEALVSACLAGLGMIQAPLSSLREDLDSGRLVEVMPRHRAESMPVSILYPHRRQLSRRVRVFIDWVAALFTEEMRSKRVRR